LLQLNGQRPSNIRWHLLDGTGKQVNATIPLQRELVLLVQLEPQQDANV